MIISEKTSLIITEASFEFMFRISVGEYLELRGRRCWEAGEDNIMRNFITYTLYQILLG
jgi:hypothetical protein